MFEIFKRYSFSSPFGTLPRRIIVGADSISAREKSLQINEIGVISFAGGYGIRPYGLSFVCSREIQFKPFDKSKFEW